MRLHYRNSLLQTVAANGLAKSKIQVLEALLRLRQAACHPGLLDPKRHGDSSAKLDVLLDRLEEIVAEGHKALVFSQFTSLLSLVRERLDDSAMVYEYLDGATRLQNHVKVRSTGHKGAKAALFHLEIGIYDVEARPNGVAEATFGKGLVH